MDACVHVVTDDGAEFEAFGIEQLAIDHGAVMGTVMTEIRGDGACAEIDLGSDDRVPDERQVADGGVGKDEGVFHFHRMTDDAVIGDAGRAADVAIGANFAVIADDDIALNHHARQDA